MDPRELSHIASVGFSGSAAGAALSSPHSATGALTAPAHVRGTYHYAMQWSRWRMETMIYVYSVKDATEDAVEPHAYLIGGCQKPGWRQSAQHAVRRNAPTYILVAAQLYRHSRGCIRRGPSGAEMQEHVVRMRVRVRLWRASASLMSWCAWRGYSTQCTIARCFKRRWRRR